MASSAELAAVLRARADTSEFKSAAGDLDAVESKFHKLGAAGTAALAGVAALGAGLVALGKQAFDLGAQFDEAYDRIRVGTGATGEALEGLKNSFRSVAADAPSSFDQISTAIATLNQRLGTTGAPLEAMATQFLNLSRITGTDVAENIRLGTRLFGDWGVATEDQAEKLDRLFATSQKTGASIGQLASGVVEFGAPLRQLGFTLEESLALLGKFEAEGVNTEKVMGGLRIAVGKLADAGIPLEAGFQGVLDLIGNLEDASAATSLAMEVFGARAGPDMAAAIREGRFAINDLLDALDETGDTIQGAADDTEDAAERWTKAQNRMALAMEPVGEAVFNAAATILEQLLPAIEDAVQGATPLIKAFGESVPGALNAMGTAIDAGIGKLYEILRAAQQVAAGVSGFMAQIGAMDAESVGGSWGASETVGGSWGPGGGGSAPTGGTNYRANAAQWADYYGIPSSVFTRLINQESGFNPNALSPAGARGIAQFMPGTGAGVARELGISEQSFWADPNLQLMGSAHHLRSLMNRYGGDITRAVAAYNAGAGNVDNGAWLGFGETRSYVSSILGPEYLAAARAGARPPSSSTSSDVNEQIMAAFGRRGAPGATSTGRSGTAGGRGPREEAQTIAEQAIDGFIEAARANRTNLEAAFGALGGAALSALGEAMATNSKSSGSSVFGAMDRLIEEMRKQGVPNWREMGDDLAGAFHDALIAKTPEARAAAIAMIEAINEAIAERGRLTAERFLEAFGAAQIATQLGTGGRQIMGALTSAIEEGGARNIEALGQSMEGMRTALLSNPDFTPARAQELFGQVMEQAEGAIRDKSPEAQQAFRDFLIGFNLETQLEAMRGRLATKLGEMVKEAEKAEDRINRTALTTAQGLVSGQTNDRATRVGRDAFDASEKSAMDFITNYVNQQKDARREMREENDFQARQKEELIDLEKRHADQVAELAKKYREATDAAGMGSNTPDALAAQERARKAGFRIGPDQRDADRAKAMQELKDQQAKETAALTAKQAKEKEDRERKKAEAKEDADYFKGLDKLVEDNRLGWIQNRRNFEDQLANAALQTRLTEITTQRDAEIQALRDRVTEQTNLETAAHNAQVERLQALHNADGTGLADVAYDGMLEDLRQIQDMQIRNFALPPGARQPGGPSASPSSSGESPAQPPEGAPPGTVPIINIEIGTLIAPDVGQVGDALAGALGGNARVTRLINGAAPA